MASKTVASAGERLRLLRQAMQKANLAGLVIPTADAHMSEYLGPADKQREHLTGFTGSQGTAIVTQDKAALWTDGRYFLQAGKQLDSEHWQLMKMGVKDTPELHEWLISELKGGDRVGAEAQRLARATGKKLREKLADRDLSLVSVGPEVFAACWPNQPPASQAPAFVHELKYAGVASEEKIAAVRKQLAKADAEALVVAALDEIAWLLNVRGDDIAFTPVVLSFALVTMDSVTWFIDDSKLTDEVRAHVPYVTIAAYSDILPHVAALNEGEKQTRVWLDPSKCSMALFEQVPEKMTHAANSPIARLQAQKNATELAGLTECSIRDSAALVEYFYWLEKAAQGGEDLDECSVAEKLHSIRKEKELFFSESFDTISSSGPNAAIIHYKPRPGACAKVTADQMYLCDSGAQYYDGTTDITRTMHFGTPSDFERRCFTRVLQGFIAVAKCVFPYGTSAHTLDVLARLPLWQDGLNYRHGTGHGVGCFLGVHEGPTLMSYRTKEEGSYFINPMEPGMTVTIEPGYYEDGAFGIRIENDMIIVEKETEHQFGGLKSYGFQSLTWVPIQTKLVDAAMLTDLELEWLNQYNATCNEKVSGRLSSDAIREHLAAQCAPLTR